VALDQFFALFAVPVAFRLSGCADILADVLAVRLAYIFICSFFARRPLNLRMGRPDLRNRVCIRFLVWRVVWDSASVLTHRLASYAAIALRIFAMRRNVASTSALVRVAPAG
jgi:hypothetical protein